MAVTDYFNNRVLFYQFPLSNNQAAFAIIGQSDFISNTAISPPTLNSTSSPRGIIFDKGYIWLSAGADHRVSLFPLPY